MSALGQQPGSAGGPSLSIKPGDLLAGKYQIERVLGAGGMGVVVAATHLQLGQRVAIKTLLPEALRSNDVVTRFSQEARATVRIQSEHVVRVLDVGQLDSGAPYMVMEYLDGLDLAQLLKRRGPLPLQEAIDYVLQACEALAEAHRAGIIHRDIKPSNLFLTRRGDGSPLVKVLDFGISKATLSADGTPSHLTQTMAVLGSPHYMSPEQLKSARSVDQRTDIWSLGLVLYELLAGKVAFHADTLAELHVAILAGAPAPLRQQRADVPPAIEAVVLRCLEKTPATRFSSVAELAQSLAEFAAPASLVSVERAGRVLGVATSLPPPSQVAPQRASPSQMGAPSPMSQGYPPQQQPPSPQQAPPGYVQSTAHSAGVASQAPYGAGYAPQAPAPMVPYAPPGQASLAWQPTYSNPHNWQVEQQKPKAKGTSPAAIILIILVALVVLGGAGCVMCVCVSAAV